jgi:phenylpropionate dioxygenase-like ring-hydroxylating dioxygenase large terminal subunit
MSVAAVQSLEYPKLCPLPLGPYVPKEHFEREREKVFKHAWLNMGSVEEISSPGNYVVRDIAVLNASLIIARSKAGKVRGSYYVCMHRGNSLM